jgi:nicotinamide-nucleotide amidase
MADGVALLAIGDELLSGIRGDTNCTWLASRLHDAGVPVRGIQVLPDDEGPILEALGRWVGKVEFIVLSGGLGPTHDDRTREALARYLGVGLKPDEEAYDRIVSRFAEPLKSRIEATRSTQSLIPVGARGLFNSQGSALGISFSAHGTEVFAFPGVPWEFRAMAEESFLPRIRNLSSWKQVLVAGWPESLLAEKLKGTLEDAALHVSILPSAGLVTLVFRGEAEKVEAAVSRVRGELPSDCLEEGEADMATAVVALARKKGVSLSCAESCTGGLVGAGLTGVPGSSSVFLGSAVCYSNGAKTSILGVGRVLLGAHGAVSGECAVEMARGARRVFGSDLAIATTGIAGPDGGTAEKPVGTVWFGVSGPAGERSFVRNLAGDRSHIRRWSTAIALETLWRNLKEG